jgi:hypothetical protein
MKEDIQILLNRRKELKEQINKMQKEYSALGRTVSKMIEVAKEEKEQKTLVKLQEQLEQQTRNGRTEVLVENKDLSLISGRAMNEGKSFVDAKQLQNMIDDYER